MDSEFEEWQVVFAISKDFSEFASNMGDFRFIPYLGVKYSDVDTNAQGLILSTPYETHDVNSEDKFGVFVGFDIFTRK